MGTLERPGTYTVHRTLQVIAANNQVTLGVNPSYLERHKVDTANRTCISLQLFSKAPPELWYINSSVRSIF